MTGAARPLPDGPSAPTILLELPCRSWGRPMSWSKLFPELELIDDAKERDRIVSRCHREMISSGRYWLSLVGLMFVALPAACVGIQLLLDWIGVPRSITKAIISAVVGATLLSGLELFWWGPVRRCLRRELNDLRRWMCEKCGCDLRRQVEPRCPKCGTAFDPKSLQAPQRRLEDRMPT